ncbi:phage tail protein [Cohnella sp. LGH]|uniref:phage tail protein n=1 Tax=Cohnella sp. LGH TaxID=1619153 RepID=UPI001ADB556F|nr:phage tail protein [Cohnella sp. LGH]QTH41258.1 phage tail protein [Cohnella sp. LGH]
MILNANEYTEPERPRLYVATPNRTIVGELPEAYNIKLNTKLGNVPTLNFSLPYRIARMNKQLDNPNIKKTKNRYLIKYVYGTEAEWFMIKAPSDIMEDMDRKDIQCYGLAYELADKNVRKYEATSKNVTQILSVILESSLWKLGVVDADFDTMYRSLSVSDSNALDVVFDVASTFGSLVTFNSEQRTINLVQFDEYGMNKGLEVAYGSLLKSATKSESTDEFFTLFKGFGANGIGIQSVNVTGSNYLLDVSYFMYPFSRNDQRNVLAHSDYMSDSLCHALLDYRGLLESKRGIYKGYLSSLQALQDTLTDRTNELYDLKNELASIENQIADANYNKQSTSALVTQKNAKNLQIAVKNSEIASAETGMDNVEVQIATLQQALSLSANFTVGQLEELNPYIIEGTYENTNITKPEQLYEVLVKEFDKVKQPKLVVEINMVNLLEVVEEQDKWDKFRLGDVLTIRNAGIGLNVQAKIIELNYDFESGDIGVVISNVRELLSDEERFLRELYNSRTASQNVISNSGLWNQASEEASEAQQILKGVWDATARSIQASVDNTVTIDRKGVIVSDPNTPDDILILQKGLLAISRNGGNTWSTAINANGVFAERLVGQILVGTDLSISNSSGSVNINANGMTVTDMSLSVVNSTFKSKVLINPNDGLKVQKNTGTSGAPVWLDQISLDSSGNALFGGVLSIGSGGAVVKADGNTGLWVGASAFANAPFRVDLNGKITATNVELKGGFLGWGNFNVNSDGVITATGANITGNITMTNGSIQWANINSDPIATNAASTAYSALAISSAIANGTYTGGTFISGSQIYSPSIFGGTIAIGSGNNIFKADENGIYLGNSTFANAPFRVGMNGSLVARSGTFSGTVTGSTITASSIQTASSGTRVTMSSGYSDMYFYHDSYELFRIYDDITAIRLGTPQKQINCDGDWYFWGNVHGVISKWG